MAVRPCDPRKDVLDPLEAADLAGQLSAKASELLSSVMGTASWSCVRPNLGDPGEFLALRRKRGDQLFIAATSGTFPSAMPNVSAVG